MDANTAQPTYTYRCRRCLNAAFQLNAAGVCSRCYAGDLVDEVIDEALEQSGSIAGAAGLVDVRATLEDVRTGVDAALFQLDDEHEAGVRREVRHLVELVTRLNAAISDW